MHGSIRNAGSFRDPAGYIVQQNERIFRVVHERAREAYETARDSGILELLAKEGDLIAATEVPRSSWDADFASAAYVLEHPRIPFISYPYEWAFRALKLAALHHFDLNLKLLSRGLTLSDATAYNIQFLGPKAIFIDTLSVRPYRKGEYWRGHRQFCEQFLNPLLLRALTGIPHNAWFRGSLDGIATSDMARILPIRSRFSWNVLTHVLLQARLEERARKAPDWAIDRVKSTPQLSLAAYRGILLQLRRWIARLTPSDRGKTLWADYAKTQTYNEAAFAKKRRFVSEFVAKTAPAMLMDLGCNTGKYSLAALDAGARYVVGFDLDQNALDAAFSRAQEKKAAFLPLWLDAANPSPDQGWLQSERSGFGSRAHADAMIALAFEHHLAIARNIPLGQMLDWLLAIASTGVIEFVPKSDPTIQKMLSLREDVFDQYTRENFEGLLSQRSRIVRKQQVTDSGRTLFWYCRQ